MPKRPTSADVAAAAGVSRTTVSFVLNEREGVKIPDETRQRVLAAAAKLDYHPNSVARQLAGGASRALGLVLRQTPEQVANDGVLAETLRGLSDAARAANHRVLVETLAPADGHYANLLRSGRTDGLIVSGPRYDDIELVELVRDGFPVVIQGSQPGLDVPSVDVDNEAGARMAVEHLLSLGHRRIACITNAPLAYTAASERLTGYREALAAAGLPDDPALVAEGAFDASSGHRAIAEILARTTPDAIFVASDVVAIGAIAGLRDAGFAVPGDVSVVSFDAIPLAAYLDPPLTTIRLPAYDLGLAAGRAILERIAGRPVAARTLLPTELIVRASTAPRHGAVARPA
ncbi:MAG TPA: LacI family DNA-binding transcriptional regulator [Candidatus Limnocylindrales bacterium]|jgi:DNA-binding LacI/PurR family transcriptional regulator